MRADLFTILKTRERNRISSSFPTVCIDIHRRKYRPIEVSKWYDDTVSWRCLWLPYTTDRELHEGFSREGLWPLMGTPTIKTKSRREGQMDGNSSFRKEWKEKWGTWRRISLKEGEPRWRKRREKRRYTGRKARRNRRRQRHDCPLAWLKVTGLLRTRPDVPLLPGDSHTLSYHRRSLRKEVPGVRVRGRGQ